MDLRKDSIIELDFASRATKGQGGPLFETNGIGVLCPLPTDYGETSTPC